VSSDEQFTAKGPAIIGFQTYATDGPIDRGAEIVGNQRGVLGQCATPGGPEAVGVCGLGAPLAGGNTPNPSSSPTTGVLGLGGRRDDLQNHDRGPHGGGVVGVAGARPPSRARPFARYHRLKTPLMLACLG